MSRINSPAGKLQYDPIDPRWLLKAVGVVVVAALVCGYITLCLLFYQGQWQFVLHPTGKPSSLSTIGSVAAQPVLFDAAESGTPRLSGAFISAPQGSRYESYTILYLRDGAASLSQSTVDARNLSILHTLGINIFAFDYRGFGLSDPMHPTQTRMTQDADAAFRYLRDSRSIPETHVIPFGVALGASLATALSADHPAIPAAIVQPPWRSALADVLADPRARLFPVRALFHETFSLDSLSTLATPKLLLLDNIAGVRRDPLPPVADPKFTLVFEQDDTQSLTSGIARFLDQYLAH